MSTNSRSAIGAAHGLAAPRWYLCGHSRRGHHHALVGKVNQDALGWWLEPLREGACTGASVFKAALADGHGAAPHTRSDIGAQLAVQAALDSLPVHARLAPAAPVAAWAIAQRWRELVSAHWQTHPPANAVERHLQGLHGAPTELAQAAQAAYADSTPYRLYGSTLLAAAATPDWLLTAQIGDGDLLVAQAQEPLRRMPNLSHGLVGEQTFSLCLPNAEHSFSLHVVDVDWDGPAPPFVMLSTDGLAKSFGNDAAFLAVAEQLRAMAHKPGGMAQLQAQLPAWLDEVSAKGAGDDLSVLIAAQVAPD